MFIATFEASRGNDFLTVGRTRDHATALMVRLWAMNVEEFGPFRFNPVVSDINVMEVKVGQGMIDYNVVDID